MGNFESHSETLYGLDLADLDIDEAYVMYNNSASSEAWIYSLSDECVECFPELEENQPVGPINGYLSGKINTQFPLHLYIGPNNKGNNFTFQCSQDASFGEYGVYSCNISSSEGGKFSCSCSEVHSAATKMYYPILCAVAFFVGLAILWLLGIFINRKVRERSSRWNPRRSSTLATEVYKSTSQLGFPTATAAPTVPPPEKPKTRVKAIDTFRGICISLMIFVNYGGGDYWFFNHSPWNGLTFADVVFPWFMFLMGICIPISTRSLIKRKKSKFWAFVKILKRSCWLFLLGLGISNIDYIDVVNLRIFGVLQRFAFTYLIIASLHLLFTKTGRPAVEHIFILRDIIDLVYEWLIVLLIVMLHLFLIFFLPVPGCPTGYFGPGGRSEYGQYMNCTGGATGYVDQQVLGFNHMYQNPTPKPIYDTVVPFDPEGILGILEACFSVFLGVQGGMILITFKKWKSRVIRWMIWCIITGAIGATLCKCSAEDGWIPVNKNLWSISFVLVTACFGYFLLSLFYIIVDVLNWWNGAPFFYPGMNSILLYVGHEIAFDIFPFQWYDSNHPTEVETHGYKLVLDLWVVVVWVIISMWLYSINFFVAL